MTQYKMFSDEAVSKFREFCAVAGFNQPNPEGAFDAKPRYARDAAPVDDMARLIGNLLADNAKLRRGMATDHLVEPFDDVTDDLAKLKSILAAHMPPNAYEDAKKTIEVVIQRVSELVKVAHSAMNKAGSADQPPPFGGRPRREGGLGEDSKPAWSRLLPDADASWERMHKNMSRIGHV